MKFYIFDQPRFTSSYAYGEKVEPINLVDEKKDICPGCKRSLDGIRWLPPYRVSLEKPKYADFIYGTFDTMLVSENFKNRYEGSGLRGITAFHPVEIVKIGRLKPDSPPPPKYYYIEIIRTKTRIDEERSQLVRELDEGEDYCKVCRIGGEIKSYRGAYIIESTWTGEDIFFTMSFLPGTIFVTQRFVDFVKENNFTNVNFIPAKGYMFSYPASHWVEMPPEEEE
jgi:hypothetical protein